MNAAERITPLKEYRHCKNNAAARMLLKVGLLRGRRRKLDEEWRLAASRAK
jgi:hypothetical protein